ncbi:putative FBD-associated F-box protein [Raphanus sativus]|uniref:FBD-associated F-box protein At1g50980 n=1 Tax=Raphanus sativus TaxID=3726 RepID=A0A9W3CBU6_RAPSA|nr:putative FBD-associated F-box protein At1g50980 [Raphanus sativus]KAJ4882139.1 putative FBD-associated F-box protein [Raphanus sativus]
MDDKVKKRDLICELPDELLLKILSSLPSKDAVATSVLSKRWQSLWKEMKTFRYDEELRCGNARIASKLTLFISRRSRVEILQLKLTPCYEKTIIKRLVNNAVARSLRELRIEMVYDSFELPESLFSCPQLETLILQKLSLVDVPPNADLSSLKHLHLLSVRFSYDESVKTLLSICPRLEELVVRRSSYTNVKIFAINVPTLRSLSVDNSSGKSRPKGVHGFEINAPSLRCFSIRDSFSNYLRFRNMPKLVKSTVNVVCDIMI